MLKQLLSVAAVSMMTLQASALDLTLEDLGSGWGDTTYDAATHTITYVGDWTGKGWWLGDVDYSAYTHFVMEIEPATIQAQANIEYVNSSDSSSSGLCELGATEITTKLNDDFKSNVKQIYVQCGSLTDAPTIVIKSAKLVDNSGKAPDLVLWEGEQIIDWWENALTIETAKFENLEAGDALAFTYTLTGDGGSIKIQELVADWSQTILPSFEACEGYQAEWGTVYLSESGVFTLPMDAADVELVKNPSNHKLMLCGDGVIATKAEIVKNFSGVQSIVSDTESAPVYYNLQGVQVTTPSHGIYVVKRGNKVTKEIIR